MKKVVIIGATSGIGKRLAKVFADNGYVIGMAGRRVDILSEIQQGLQERVFVKRIDVSEPDEAIGHFKDLLREMGGTDIVVISAGVCFDNPDLEWVKEKTTIDVNITGFALIAGAAFDYFARKGLGHIVGISSVRALRGGWSAPAYNASKAFVSNYLEGLSIKAERTKADIAVSDIRPGFVETPMTRGKKKTAIVAGLDIACDQIFHAIIQKRRCAYILRRWSVIAFLLRIMPYRIYKLI